MTFNEALQELLKGKKVRRVKWGIKEDYIMLDTAGYVVWNDSTCFNPNTADITGDWEEYHSLKSGSRFVKDGQNYRVVSVPPSSWSLINVDDWYVVYGALTSDDLTDKIRDKGFKKLDYKGKATTPFNDYYTKENIYSTDTVAKIVDENSKDEFAMVRNTDGDTFCISHPFKVGSNYEGTNKLVIISHENGVPILTRITTHPSGNAVIR